MVLCCIMGMAKGEPSQALPDSVVTEDNVYRYMFSDTGKAEAIMEALRERKKMPDWELDYTEGDLWFNTGRYYRALKCYARVLESDRAKKDNTLYMDMLHRMISCYDCTHNEARKAEYMERLLSQARACGDKAMQAVALFNIGKSEYNQGSKAKGYRHMEEATRMMEATDYKNKYDNLRYHYNTLLVYYEKDRWGEDALRTLDELEKVATASTGQEKSIDGLDEKKQKAFYGHRTVVYNILGRDAEADESYRTFLSLGKPTDRDNYLVMPYLFDRHKYGEILRISRQREQMLRSQGDTVNYHMVSILRQLGRACRETGDYEAASGYFERLATLRDSIKNREQQSAVLELAEVYESGEKDKTILRQQLQTRILLAVVVIVLAVVGIVIAYNRKIRRRNVSLVRAVKESVAVKEELLQLEEECLALKGRLAAVQEARTEPQPETPQPAAGEAHEETEPELSEKPKPELIEKTNTEPEPSPVATGKEEDNGKSDRDKEQIRRLVHEIDSRRLYLNTDLTQKDILEFVQIPAYRFGAAFKRHAGTSFSDYINNKRMEYAVKLLTEHPEYTIEAVAGMCGIKSKQHFHRQFSAYTGLTPATFRHSSEKTDNQ